jgi:uncharacterized glyoxalase superfamily protein PhnB
MTTVIPAIRISSRDTIAFYAKAFGAKAAMVAPADGDQVDHAELTIEGAMFMCGTGREGSLDQPVGGSSTYWVLDEDGQVDAMHDQAVAAGATSLFAPYEADYGGRHATVRDPDGNAFSFGTYRPEAM